MNLVPIAGLAAAAALAVVFVLLRAPQWSLVLVLASSPIGLYYIGPAQVITVVSIVAVMVTLVSRWIAGLPMLPGTALTGAILLWCAAAVLSVICSPWPADTALFGCWLIVAGLLCASVPAACPDRRSLLPVLVALLISGLVIATAGQFINPPVDPTAEATADYGGAVVVGRATSVFAGPNELGLYCMMVSILALAIAVRSRGWLRWLAVPVVISCIYMLIQSYSRGAWVGWVLGMVALAVIEPRARKPMGVSAAAVVAAGIGFAMLVPNSPALDLVSSRAESILNPAANPDDNRPQLMAEGMRQLSQWPVTGVGPLGYKIEGNSTSSLERTVGGEHAHNMFLTTAAEEGIVGIAAAVAVICSLLVLCVPVLPIVTRRLGRPPQPRDWVVGLLSGGVAALSGLVIAGMVDYPIRNATARSIVWLVIGTVAAAAEILRRELRRPHGGPDIGTAADGEADAGGEAGDPAPVGAASADSRPGADDGGTAGGGGPAAQPR